MTKEVYAYVHCKPDGTPFYVGKGSSRRVRNMSDRSEYHKKIVAKYGRKNLLIGVLPCSSEATAFELEKGLIKCLRNMGYKLCNLTDGGEGPSGVVISKAHRERLSQIRTGMKLPAVWCENISKALKGKPQTPEVVAARAAGIQAWYTKATSEERELRSQKIRDFWANASEESKMRRRVAALEFWRKRKEQMK